MGASMASGVEAAVGQVTGAFSAVTGWWIVGVAVAFFGAGLVVNLIASFFGKRKGKRRK